ncbi:MAG: hypothetical protein H6791_03030 [Candidatus Nomurabacteria bacterium]|nr:MAG: hypothetical protein H6791_03030 [Candidatus Nomurabacteria bacterium]
MFTDVDTCVMRHYEPVLAPINLCSGGTSRYQKVVDYTTVYDTCITRKNLWVAVYGNGSVVVYDNNRNPLPGNGSVDITNPGTPVPGIGFVPPNPGVSAPGSGSGGGGNETWNKIWPWLIAALVAVLAWSFISLRHQKSRDAEQRRRHADNAEAERLRSARITNDQAEENLRAQRARTQQEADDHVSQRKLNAILAVMDKVQKDGSDDRVTYQNGDEIYIIESSAHPAKDPNDEPQKD